MYLYAEGQRKYRISKQGKSTYAFSATARTETQTQSTSKI